MKSIKLKLFIGIVLILSIFLGGMFTYGATFKGYFQNEKLQDMGTLIEEVEDIIRESGLYNINSKTEKLAEKYNVQIEIEESSSGQVICSTHNDGRNGMMGHGMGGQNRYENIEIIGVKNDIERKVILDKSSGVKFLTATKNINDSSYYIKVQTPINIMDEAVSKSLSLHMIIFIPITIVVFILTALFSNIFTKPIIEIRRKTARIENLDFNGELNITGEDEISELGSSVNNLSHKIENTLEDLNSKNMRLQEMIDKERENEIIRREFVSSVSHELKSPIAVISGYAQALEEGVVSSKEDLQYYVGVINEESKRMQVIVNDLLDLYKLESNTFKLEIREFSLDTLINKIIRKNSIKFRDKDLQLSVELQCINIFGDKIRIEQAIQNYINNALSHMDKDKILKVELKKVDNEAVLSVYNSGENIEKSNIDKIWQGFVRVDRVRNYKENRVGLGLAIVKQIVKLHKGECGVENISTGVVFWMKFPIAK